MKTLLKVSTPKPIDAVFDNLFIQVAAKHGCGDDLYVGKTRRTVDCAAGCSNCRVEAILKEFNQHVERITRRTVVDYAYDVLRYRIGPASEGLAVDDITLPLLR